MSAVLRSVPCSLANVHFPKLASSPPARHPASSKDSRTVKLSQAYIQPLEPCPAPVMIWVPSSQHITHKPLQWRPASPHVTVMQISCRLPPQFGDPLDWRKSKSGAKRIRFQASGKPEARVGRSADGEPDVAVAVDARGGDMLLENMPEVLHNVRQRRQRGAPSRDVLAPDYVPDTKESWESLTGGRAAPTSGRETAFLGEGAEAPTPRGRCPGATAQGPLPRGRCPGATPVTVDHSVLVPMATPSLASCLDGCHDTWLNRSSLCPNSGPRVSPSVCPRHCLLCPPPPRYSVPDWPQRILLIRPFLPHGLFHVGLCFHRWSAWMMTSVMERGGAAGTTSVSPPSF
ncbi:uncharacterized protein LOC125713167 isoform X3 [Brienomyrus brachyistius]|uniref:uncharacterized protein LOC125713167 isoform X3 n=1 Tax=Brienomyrus brachyistius TaxID=42636 RepID=UPI0020B28D61|nr:uncharacterized protein LOC125713167 isoform X3 [Brienomyrus brachyistius]